MGMLSLYAILVLTLSLSVDGKCQRGEDSICFIAEMPDLELNRCCRGFECTELEGGNGDKFCMEKNATRVAAGDSCKGFSRNCEAGLACKASCQRGEKCKGEFVLFLSVWERIVSSQRAASPETVARA